MYYFLVLIVLFGCVHSHNIGTYFRLSNEGMQFLLMNPVQLLDTIKAVSLTQCAFACIMFQAKCRTFEFDSSTLQCRLVDGDLTTGQIIPSTSSSKSIVGTVNLIPELFVDYGQSCSQCADNKFFTCINNTCQCAGHSYFDGSICKLQQFTGAECNSTNACRNDLNLTCLQFFQCGPLSVLIGLTVAGNDTGMYGGDAMTLRSPMGLAVMPNGDLYVADRGNHRIQFFLSGSLVGQTIAGDGTSGSSSTQLSQPIGIHVNPLTRNVYIADADNSRIQLWINNATQGQTIIGVSTLPSLFYSIGVRLDIQGRIYVSDYGSDSVIRWPANGTNGIIVAGSGSTGSDNRTFDFPYQIDLDSSGKNLYVADYNNHRIQKWQILSNDSAAATAGVTVAGGNGAGNGAAQLNYPVAVCVSAKTGAIYIVDMMNHRIQRWSVGARQGVTVAGGSIGNAPTQLNTPGGVALDPNETYLYVADQANHRVQRFILI